MPGDSLVVCVIHAVRCCIKGRLSLEYIEAFPGSTCIVLAGPV